MLAAQLSMAACGTAGSAPAETVFTVANYPVEARAKDAVAAKEKALADGQRAALRSLIKRLIPVTAYGRLRKLNVSAAGTMIDGVSVRSERNSSTDYFANLDFAFQPQAVRALLQREGLAFVETQAPVTIVVPIWRILPGQSDLPPVLGPDQGTANWMDAWRALDLTHTLTPAKVEKPKPEVAADTIRALAAGDSGMVRAFAAAYTGAERIIAAIAEPDGATKRLNVTLIGTDAVGAIAWKRAYRIDSADPGYAVELAAVVSLGVLEGRWKAGQARGGAGDIASAALQNPAGGNGGDGVRLAIEFRGMSEWQDISRRLTQTAGVDEFEVAGLSARSARVSLRYPGGPLALAETLSRQGFAVVKGPDGGLTIGLQ